MTRINCVPPAELSDKHLGAEYRELPRVFRLVAKAISRGESPSDVRNPSDYRLGAGHVRFFYPRLLYLKKRFRALVRERRRRGHQVNFPELPDFDIPRVWYKDWKPTPHALKINRERIRLRS